MFEGDHPDVAHSLQSLGVSYSRLGDKKEAAEYLEKALEMRQRLFEGDHPDVADSVI